ncbi:hypothetical protein KCP76_05890 [Salmonella enterica subsp. enterica serovar Weltevreden]|nr:hypothetical protein KCP76_05890 [Salmonella enterica subsp. enterica serovar Weltevreden]
MLKKELQADADAYGDDRRSRCVSAKKLKAMSEHDMLPSEPVTTVLSQMGWCAAPKRHAILMRRGLTIKRATAFKAAVKR